MTKFSQNYGIRKKQAELDFVDVDTERDLPLFLDPYVFTKRNDIWSLECNDAVTSFFEAVLDNVINKNDKEALFLLSKLGEPNETCLGLSQGNPSGRGVGGIQAERIFYNLKNSKAAKTGILTDLADCELFVDQIGPDKISDITTNIIRKQLITYTQEQCDLHSIPLENIPSGWLWDPINKSWSNEYTELPVVKGRKIILIPKSSARWKLGFSHQEYYNDFVLTYLQAEHLEQQSALVETIVNKKMQTTRQRVTKKSLKEVHPLEKDFLAAFTKDNPEVLENYKNLIGVTKELKDFDLEEGFREEEFAKALKQNLLDIPYGSDDAETFHQLMVGALEFIFYPHLTHPVKECEINQGRKRIDMIYTNTSIQGFFFRARAETDIKARKVIVECKNYTKDIANPELDQLMGRFSNQLGRLGFLIARKLDNRNRFIERCRDTVKQGNGAIILFEDSDIIELLTFIENNNRLGIERYLTKRLDEIIL